MITWALRVVVAVAAAQAILVARQEREHRPVAVALTATLAFDVLRALVLMPHDLALALYLLPDALAVWVALRAFTDWSVAPVIIFWSVLMLRANPSTPTPSLAVAVVVQGTAALTWVRRREPFTVWHRCALVLLAGDVFALLGPMGPIAWPRAWWPAAAAQGAIVALGLICFQASWLRARSLRRAIPVRVEANPPHLRSPRLH